MISYAQRQEVLVPELPDAAVKLKVDRVSNNIRLDEEPLMRSLLKIRSYAKAVTDAGVTYLRSELEAQVINLRSESQFAIKDALLNRDGELAAQCAQHDTRLKAAEDEVAKLRESVEKIEERIKDKGAKESRRPSLQSKESRRPSLQSKKSSQDLGDDGEPGESPSPVERAESRLSQRSSQRDPKSQPSSPSKSQPSSPRISPRITVGLASPRAVLPPMDLPPADMDSEDRQGDQSPRSPGESPRSPRDRMQRPRSRPSNDAPKADTTSVDESLPVDRNSRGDAYRLGQHSDSQGSLCSVDDRPLSESSVAPSRSGVDTQQLQEQAEALQAEFSDRLEELEGNLRKELCTITSRMQDAEAKHQADIAKNQADIKMDIRKIEALLNSSEERAQGSQVSFQKMRDEVRELRQGISRLETESTTEEAIRNVQGEMRQLQIRIEQAEVIEPKLYKLAKDMELLSQSCQGTERGLVDAAQNASQLHQQVESCSQQLTQVARRSELEQRCHQLSQQTQSVTILLKDVEIALGDMSEAILRLSSKAEQEDLAHVRDELSMFAETIKDRETSVLFGARCLSCNRVFDEVCKDAGAVDLPVEKQREALFAQVQRALHSPGMDPMAKIKMLAVKVGRQIAVSGKSGVSYYEGRDSSGFACGANDMELMPEIRGSSALSGDDGRVSTPLQRPATSTPRPGKRGPRGRNDAYRVSRRDVTRSGTPLSMDYTHPLADLVDRTRSGRSSALG